MWPRRIISLPSFEPIVIVGCVRAARPVVEPPAPGGEARKTRDGQPGHEPRGVRECRGRVGSSRRSTSPRRRVADQGQQRRRDRAQQDQPRVGERDAAEDVAAQPAGADGRGDRRHAHARRPWPRGPRPARSASAGAARPGGAAARPVIPRAMRRLADPGIDALQPEDRVLDDRQQGVEHERRQRRGLADLAPKGDQQEPQQGQAGDGLEHARDADRRPARGAAAARRGCPAARPPAPRANTASTTSSR